MANTVILSGYFGVKQAYWVSDPDVTTGWYAGQLFKVDSIGSSGAAALKGASASRGPFVGLNDSSGAAITGIALENSSEQSTAVAGMAHPSGSKVTILHGHSTFSIKYGGTATTALLRNTGGAPWEPDVESGTLMDLLYASANGKFCTFLGGTQTGIYAAIDASTPPIPVGYLSQVPAAANSWIMGVVLFG